MPMYTCPCGTEMEAPTGSVQLFSMYGDLTHELCARCTRQIVAVLNGNAAAVTVPRYGWYEVSTDEDGIDDVDRPLEVDA